MFKAQCITVRDPFHPMRGREIRLLDEESPISALAPDTKQPFIILRNGQAVLRQDWHLPVADGDLLAVVLLPQDGNNGGSDVLRIILMIVVVVFAWYVAPELAVAYGGSSGVWAAAIGIVGSALINAILPPPTAALSGGLDAKSASPTYNLAAQGNTARIEGAIPIQYGRMNVFPDFAASPYVEYQGNEQYLYQLLCIGVGEFEIEQIRIEDSDISSFEEITYEIVEPNQTLSLFPAAVSTSGEVSGQEMLYNTELGPFTANAAGTLATKISIDTVCPRGLYYATDSGSLASMSISYAVMARLIDDNDTPLGSWVTLGTQTIEAATSTPQRYTDQFSVSAGRYQVKIKRTTEKYDSTRAGHEIVWAGLRTHLVSDATFGNVTLLAIKARATNNLSQQSSRKINVTCTRKLYIWTGSAWAGPTATRSIAWALADACHVVGLPDNRIDLAGLIELDAIWTARGDVFNGRFDSTGTFWDALTKIARAGRCKPYMQGGIVHFFRDQPQSLPVALYSMRNIVRGSFSMNFITPSEDTADSVQISYFDDTTWKPRTLLCKLPGATSEKPAKVELFGVTSRQQAYREGIYLAAANRYRRTLITFTTEMEGFIPAYGDLVAISHDMPAWGQGAEVVDWISNRVGSGIHAHGYGGTLTLSEPMVFGSGTHYIGMSRRDGAVGGPYAVTGLVPDHGANLLPNAGFDADSSGWGAQYEQVPSDADGWVQRDLAAAYGWCPTGLHTIGLTRPGTPTGYRDFGTGAPWYGQPFIDVLPGKRYCASAWMASHRCAIELWILFLAADNTLLAAATSGQESGYAGGTNLSSWKRHAVFLTAPTQAKHVMFIARQSAATAADPYSWLTQPMLEIATADQTVPSPWTDVLTAHQLMILDNPDFTIYTGQSAERTRCVFGLGETWRQPARVVSVKPKDECHVELTCVNEDANVHSADVGIFAPPINYSQLPATPMAPEVAGLSARSAVGDVGTMLISWRPAAGASNYVIEQSADGVAWTRCGETTGCNFSTKALYGSQTLVRVAALGSVRGGWSLINYALESDYMWHSDPSTPMWTNDSALMWR